MEAPIGYGSTHRSIFPESQFRTEGGSVSQGWPLGESSAVAKTASVSCLTL
jgi:hypothetical protein